MDFEMQFWDGLREWASQCLDFWKDVGSLGATSGGSRGTGLESLGFVTTALMSYWLVLLILVARGIIGMNEQGRYIAHAERYERTMATLGDSRRRQDGRWVAYYEASIDGSRRKLGGRAALSRRPRPIFGMSLARHTAGSRATLTTLIRSGGCSPSWLPSLALSCGQP